jgi:small subunit ribosomal protein S4
LSSGGHEALLERRALFFTQVLLREAQLRAWRARQEGDFPAQSVGLRTLVREKQKARRIYGVQERQFRRYFHSAQRVQGMTGVTLLLTLERRLDNVVYRLGLADSRAQARQLVRHGHFWLNGRNHDVPSYLVEVGDVIEVRSGSRVNGYFKLLSERGVERTTPQWLDLDAARLVGRVVGTPDRQSVELPLTEQLIVEYYSR